MPNLFLSYARTDDISFVSDLYGKLTGAGYSVWWDEVDMPSRGLSFLQEIRDAIQQADRLIVVIGPSAAKSDYVRAEWQHALAEGRIVIPILRLGDIDLLPTELKCFHCPDFSMQRNPQEALEELLRILDEPAPSPGPLFGVPAQPNHFLPRPDVFTRINDSVLEDLIQPGPPQGIRRVVFLNGMGGAGKSVLAAAFARSINTRRVFEEGVFWLAAVKASDPLDLMRGLGELLVGSSQSYRSESMAIRRLRDLLSGKRVLVVLDDVQDIAQLEIFTKILDTNTRLLVTGRNEELAIAVGATKIRIGGLSEPDALQHLADWAGLESESFPVEAAKLARRCGYLPFALSLSGAMVQGKSDWGDLIQALGEDDIGFLEWHERFPDYPHPSVVKCLGASLESLARVMPDYAERYRELVVFLAETIPERVIALFWRNRGAIKERHVRKVLLALERRALLRLEGDVPERRIRLHPLQRSYLRKMVPDQTGLQTALVESYRELCGGEWWNGPRDGYFLEHIVEHLIVAGKRDDVEALLAAEAPGGGNAWYEAHERNKTPGAFSTDVRRAWRELEQANKTATSAGRFPISLGFEIRCALYQASMNSLAQTRSHKGFGAMAEEKGWRAAFGMAKLTPNPQDRFNAIFEIMPAVPDGERIELLSVAANAALCIDDHTTRSWALMQVATQSEADPAIKEQALESLREVEEPETRAEILIHLLPGLSTEHQLLEKARLFAYKIDKSHSQLPRIKALASVAAFLTGTRQQQTYVDAIRQKDRIRKARPRSIAQAALIPLLPPDLRFTEVDKAWGELSVVKDPSMRAEMLKRIAPYLSDSRLATEVAKAWGGVSVIKDPRVRAEVLKRIAPYLSDSRLAYAASLMGRELKGFPGARIDRAQILRDLLQHLTNTPHFKEVLSEAVKNAHKIGDWKSRAEAVAYLEKYAAGGGGGIPEPNGSAIGQENEGRGVSRLMTTIDSHVQSPNGLYRREVTLAETVPVSGEDFVAECIAFLLAPSANLDSGSPTTESNSPRVSGYADSTSALPHRVKEFFDRTMQRLERGDDELSCADPLYRLAHRLPAELLPKMVRIIARETNEQRRAELLLRYAPRLSRELVIDGLAVANGNWVEPCWQIAALSALVPWLDEPLRSEVVEKALDLTESSFGRKRRLGAIARLAPHLFLTSRITKTRRDRVIQSTLEVAKDPSVLRQSALEAMAMIVPLLSGRQQVDLADQTWEEARCYPYVERFLTTLPRYAQLHCSVIGRDFVDYGLQEDANRDCLSLWRIWVAAKLAPALSKPFRAQAIEFSQQTADDIANELIRAEAFLQLLSMDLPKSHRDGVLKKAIMASIQIGDRHVREDVLTRLVEHLKNLPADHLYPLWCDLLNGCAERTRTEMCSDIVALSTLASRLAGRDVLREIVDAVEEVWRWRH